MTGIFIHNFNLISCMNDFEKKKIGVVYGKAETDIQITDIIIYVACRHGYGTWNKPFLNRVKSCLFL